LPSANDASFEGVDAVVAEELVLVSSRGWRGLTFSLALLLILPLVASPIFGIPLKFITLRSIAFDRDFYYQGENGTASLHILNENPFQAIHIIEIGIQFDWLVQRQLWFRITPDEELSPQTSRIYQIPFFVHDNVSPGNHNYEIGYVGIFESWNSLKNGNIAIRDVEERTAIQARSEAQLEINSQSKLLDDVSAKISLTDVETAEAKTRLDTAFDALAQARNELLQAQSKLAFGDVLLSQGDYVAAKGIFEEALLLVHSSENATKLAESISNDAISIEQQVQRAREEQSLFALRSIAIGAALAGSFATLLYVKKRRLFK